MLIDYDSIKGFVARQLPDEKRRFWSSVAEHLGKVIWKYLTSYLMIMFITFVELSIGLLCVGQKTPSALPRGSRCSTSSPSSVPGPCSARGQ